MARDRSLRYRRSASGQPSCGRQRGTRGQRGGRGHQRVPRGHQQGARGQLGALAQPTGSAAAPPSPCSGRLPSAVRRSQPTTAHAANRPTRSSPIETRVEPGARGQGAIEWRGRLVSVERRAPRPSTLHHQEGRGRQSIRCSHAYRTCTSRTHRMRITYPSHAHGMYSRLASPRFASLRLASPRLASSRPSQYT